MNGTAVRNGVEAPRAFAPNGVSKKLPSSDSPTLVLGQPTPAEEREQARANAVEWRGALSIEAYLRREEYLAGQGLAGDSGITYWILYDLEEGEAGHRRVLAGCESYKKRAFLAVDGKVQDVIVHGIGSVFTPPEYRGMGYGGRMMRELGTKLETWQTDKTPCAASVLFSDIGKKFYAKFGWHSVQCWYVRLHPAPALETNGHAQPEATPLYENDLRHLCEIDEMMVKDRLAKRGGRTAVAIAPDHASIEWHHARENFLANELYGKKPMIKGAMAKVVDERVWCIWTRKWVNENPQQSEENTLYILRLVVEDRKAEKTGSGYSESHVDAIAAVLRCAQREAREWHMQDVELWNPDQSTLAAVRRLEPEAKTVERNEESVASLRWHGSPNTEVEWLENEKFGWC